MKVEAIALSDFVHGDITGREGRTVRHRDGNLIDEGLASDLERAGLLRIKTTTTASAPASAAALGKRQDDGQGQPSSASQAAPASPLTTSSASKAGGAKTRKEGA